MPRKSVRGIIKPLLHQLVDYTLGVEANFRRIKDYAINTLGLPSFYRRKDALADIREVLGIAKKKDSWKYTPKKYLIPEEDYVIVNKPMRKKFYNYIEAKFIDEQGNEYIKIFNFSSDRLITRNMIHEQVKLWADMFENKYLGSRIISFDWQIKQLIKRKY